MRCFYEHRSDDLIQLGVPACAGPLTAKVPRFQLDGGRSRTIYLCAAHAEFWSRVLAVLDPRLAPVEAAASRPRRGGQAQRRPAARGAGSPREGR